MGRVGSNDEGDKAPPYVHVCACACIHTHAHTHREVLIWPQDKVLEGGTWTSVRLGREGDSGGETVDTSGYRPRGRGEGKRGTVITGDCAGMPPCLGHLL